MPVASLGDRKNGLLKSPGFNSIQTFSSFWYSVNKPSVFLASLITAAKGCGLPGGATAGCGVPGGTPEALGAAALAARGPAAGALAELAATKPLLPPPGASDAQPPSNAISTRAGAGRTKTGANEFMEFRQDTKKGRQGFKPVPPFCETRDGNQFNNSAEAAADSIGTFSLRMAWRGARAHSRLHDSDIRRRSPRHSTFHDSVWSGQIPPYFNAL